MTRQRPPRRNEHRGQTLTCSAPTARVWVSLRQEPSRRGGTANLHPSRRGGTSNSRGRSTLEKAKWQMQLSMWREIGWIWRKDAKSRRMSLHRTHVPMEIAWRQRSDQRDNGMSGRRVLSVGIWLSLAAAVQQTLLSVCSRLKRGGERRVLPGYRADKQKYIPNQDHRGAGEWYFKRCQARRKSSRCFFYAWKKTGMLFGEMVSNGKSSQRD